MTFIEMQKKFGSQEFFSLGELRTVEPGFYRSRLNEWQKKGYIKKIIRNYYYFSDKKFSEESLFRLANRLNGRSYVSLESALAYYSLIPDKPLSVTSVTVLRTREFATPAGKFYYRKISGRYYSDYALEGTGREAFLIAKPYKALFDLMYLENKADSDFIDALRLDVKRLRGICKKEEVIKASLAYSDRSIKNAAERIIKNG